MTSGLRALNTVTLLPSQASLGARRKAPCDTRCASLNPPVGPSSFRSQSDERIDARGPPRRQVRGELCGGVSSTIAPPIARDRSASTQTASTRPSAMPPTPPAVQARCRSDEPGPTLEHQRDDARALCSESHPDADLPGALRDAVGQQAVEPDTRQRQREQPESARQRRHHALLDDRGRQPAPKAGGLRSARPAASIEAPAGSLTTPDRAGRPPATVSVVGKSPVSCAYATYTVGGGAARRPAAFVFLTSPTISRSLRCPLTVAERCWPTGF